MTGPATRRTTLVVEAHRRARKAYRSAGFQSAYVRGATAAIYGKDAGECPYKADRRNTWRSAYRAAWMRGHDSVPRWA